MKVLVLTGSPHSQGTTAFLADEFCDGSKEAGHEIVRFETAKLNIHPCPCCGLITIPNNGDALAYICPVCFWEIDLFIQGDDEASDQNNGLTLSEARKNYQRFGAVLPRLKEHCRQPKNYEYPTK